MVALTANVEFLTQAWPPRDPSRMQLYAQPSPNGVKAMVMLAECGIEYDFHRIEFGDAGTRSAAYLHANPDGRIPLLLDPSGQDHAPVLLAESNAILLYLAQKHDRFLPKHSAARLEVLQWLFWQASSLGPAFGQIGYFRKFEGRVIEDTRPLQRQVDESRRLLGQLERRIEGGNWLVDDAYSIADIAVLPLIRNLINFYEAGDLISFNDFPSTASWLDRWLGRPAVVEALRPRD